MNCLIHALSYTVNKLAVYNVPCKWVR